MEQFQELKDYTKVNRKNIKIVSDVKKEENVQGEYKEEKKKKKYKKVEDFQEKGGE